jgi:protein involved in polysaccharide export with SLBB domain
LDMKEGDKKDKEPKEDKDFDVIFSSLTPQIFGAELFSNKNLTFEPNLKMATPKDYQLGPEDEMIIDVYGNSEITHRLKVSPEGTIRIPLVGPVSVGGLTIEQAEKRILTKLSTIYSGISSGETSVNVTLGNIRSIKVTLVGEVNLPGSYTLPSLATVFNALYASGGPNENGSFRNIRVVRSGKVIANIDIYDFLMNGQAKGNIQLQDQDVIKINPFETRVELAGEVKRPGFYEGMKNETLKDLIGYAGGFTNEAYKERIKVFRNTGKEKSVADVPADVMNIFTLQSGDKYVIDKILERYTNRIEISGAVFRPGVFALEDGMTLSKLIAKADGIKEDAYVERAIIYRLKEDNSSEMLSFSVKDVISGKTDIPLKREDFVVIASKIEMREEYTVSVNGEVKKPGSYTYGENMRVEDLIIAAGGLKESASNNVEIARRIKTIDPSSKSTEIATIIKYEINKDNLQSTSNITLMPFDNVSVFPSPGYAPQKNISIEGEVLFPGKYTISNKNERLSDIIKRSGGLTAQAYPEGASLIRMTRLSGVEQVMKQLKLEAILKQSSDTTKSQDLKTKESLDNTPSIVGIYLPEILKKPGSELDLLLEEGDVIRIPKMLQTVEISGEVLYPVKVRYEKGNGFKSYVKGAGGFSARALKSRSYIVYANGTAASTSSFFFIHFYPKVRPGAEIVVPIKEDKRKLSAIEIASIATSATTLALLIITLFK